MAITYPICGATSHQPLAQAHRTLQPIGICRPKRIDAFMCYRHTSSDRWRKRAPTHSRPPALLLPCRARHSSPTGRWSNHCASNEREPARVPSPCCFTANVLIPCGILLLSLPCQVPAKGTAEYTIEFFPLAMTTSSPPPPGDTYDSRSSAATSAGGGSGRQQQQQDPSKVVLEMSNTASTVYKQNQFPSLG